MSANADVRSLSEAWPSDRDARFALSKRTSSGDDGRSEKCHVWKSYAPDAMRCCPLPQSFARSIWLTGEWGLAGDLRAWERWADIELFFWTNRHPAL